MSGHTPGPWSNDPLGIGVESHLVFGPTLKTGHRQLITIVSTGKDTIANARLIAAAPDLLAAVTTLVRLCQIGGEDLGDALKAADSAIAKATG